MVFIQQTQDLDDGSRPLSVHPVWAHPGRSAVWMDGWIDRWMDDYMKVINFDTTTSVKTCV